MTTFDLHRIAGRQFRVRDERSVDIPALHQRRLRIVVGQVGPVEDPPALDAGVLRAGAIDSVEVDYAAVAVKELVPGDVEVGRRRRG